MTTLPSGTVTFLFSDIEGSTRLLQRLGPRYPQALDDHQRLLRAAWAAHDGVEVDTQGDAFFVVFARAMDAVAAALDAARGLAAYSWPEGTALSVRIGLHTGAPTLAGDAYVGLDVHRAARIAAAGHGGQILLSQTTRDLCEDELPRSISLRDMGEVHLKDLPRPEHLYQVVVPDLPHTFPPLKTLDRVHNNLPLQPTPFLGRQEVVKRISELLGADDVRVLTVMGPGGIGKTRVALEVAAQVEEQFPDGVYFVRLSPLTDAALVPETIVKTLSLRDASGISAEKTLHAELGARHMLLVMDNFEPVVAAAPVIARLMAACPGVKALVTSRIALRLRGEHEFVVPPLETPVAALLPSSDAPTIEGMAVAGTVRRSGAPMDMDELSHYAAIALFIARARDVKPDFALTTGNAAAVVEICRRLDGLPLAIELAAARLNMLSPQAMLTRLSKRLDLLTDGPRDLPERHHTMRAAIAWSYDLLRPAEQAVFRRLAVFAGGCTLEAAEAVCAPTLDAFNGLSALINQSLVSEREDADGEPRFQQLETIRAFAADELVASGEAEVAHAAHANYFLELAERTQREARGPDTHVWLERLEREHDNYRGALAWARDTNALTLGLRLATALSGIWHSHGHEREGERWLQELLTLAEHQIAAGEVDDALRAAHAHGLGRQGALLVYLGEFERANALLKRCLAAERALGDHDHELRALNMLGVSAQMQGDPESAAGWYEEGLAIARAAGLEKIASFLINNIGDLAYYKGDYERAAACYHEHLAMSERAGDRASVTVGLQNTGRTLLRQGHLEDAAHALRRSLTYAWRLRDPRRIAEGLEGLAALAGVQGDAKRAARLLGAATQLRETLGTPQPIPERTDIESAVADARASLGADAWAAARDDGYQQPIEQIINAELAATDDNEDT